MLNRRTFVEASVAGATAAFAAPWLFPEATVHARAAANAGEAASITGTANASGAGSLSATRLGDSLWLFEGAGGNVVVARAPDATRASEGSNVADSARAAGSRGAD